MPDALDIQMCEQATKHAQLGKTGSCMCGEKKYANFKPKPEIYRCGFCGQEPNIGSWVEGSPNQPNDIYCATEGCAAFGNAVTLEVWNQRPQHESEVAVIPLDEPIFILRGQDALALAPGWTWVDLADRKGVPEEKVNSATKRMNEMDSFQRVTGNKMPD